MESNIKATPNQKLIPIRISTHFCSFSDPEESPAESDILPIENSENNQLVRRTIDLKNLYLTKSDHTDRQKSPQTPFGPKTNALLIPAKNFDNAEIELDDLENYNI